MALSLYSVKSKEASALVDKGITIKADDDENGSIINITNTSGLIRFSCIYTKDEVNEMIKNIDISKINLDGELTNFIVNGILFSGCSIATFSWANDKFEAIDRVLGNDNGSMLFMINEIKNEISSYEEYVDSNFAQESDQRLKLKDEVEAVNDKVSNIKSCNCGDTVQRVANWAFIRNYVDGLTGVHINKNIMMDLVNKQLLDNSTSLVDPNGNAITIDEFIQMLNAYGIDVYEGETVLDPSKPVTEGLI